MVSSSRPHTCLPNHKLGSAVSHDILPVLNKNKHTTWRKRPTWQKNHLWEKWPASYLMSSRGEEFMTCAAASSSLLVSRIWQSRPSNHSKYRLQRQNLIGLWCKGLDMSCSEPCGKLCGRPPAAPVAAAYWKLAVRWLEVRSPHFCRLAAE